MEQFTELLTSLGYIKDIEGYLLCIDGHRFFFFFQILTIVPWQMETAATRVLPLLQDTNVNVQNQN